MSLLLLEKPSVPARASLPDAMRTGSIASENLRGCVAEKHRLFNPMRVGQWDRLRPVTGARPKRPAPKVLCS
jgi:hypothetical protein